MNKKELIGAMATMTGAAKTTLSPQCSCPTSKNLLALATSKNMDSQGN